MSKPKTKGPGQETAFDQAAAIDEMAELLNAKDEYERRIADLRGRIIKSLGELPAEGRMVVTSPTRELAVTIAQVSSVKWAAVAAAMEPPTKLVKQHTTVRQQVYFRFQNRER